MSNQHPEARPGDYDDVTRLRLQLHQAELQRDAFEKALRKEVLIVIREVASENAFLKAEVERLKNNCAYLDQKLDEEVARSASLSGQVTRLTDAITAGAITPDAKEVQS